MDAFNSAISADMARMFAGNKELRAKAAECLGKSEEVRVLALQYVGTAKTVRRVELVPLMRQALEYLEFTSLDLAVIANNAETPTPCAQMNAKILSLKQALALQMVQQEQTPNIRQVAIVLASRIGNQGTQANSLVCA